MHAFQPLVLECAGRRGHVHLYKVRGTNLRVLSWSRNPGGCRAASHSTDGRNRRGRLLPMELAHHVGNRLAKFISASMACTHRSTLSAGYKGMTNPC
jgi:hypothetical protein